MIRARPIWGGTWKDCSVVKFLQGVERAIKRKLPPGLRRRLRSSKFELIAMRARPIDLVVHVGAHHAEDRALYESFGARAVLWIEADPDTFTTLQSVLDAHQGPGRHIAHLGLASSTPGAEMEFHRFSGDGASSSVYRATERFRQRFSQVEETGEVVRLRSQTLPEIMAGHGIDPRAAGKALLVIDVQGHELAVLSGLGDALRDFAFCKCEISREPFYEGGAQFSEVDTHFRKLGFALVSHPYRRVPRHGDVLFSAGGQRR